MVPRETDLATHYFDLSGLWLAPLLSSPGAVWNLLRPKFKEEWISGTMRANVAPLPREGSMVTRTTELRVEGGTARVEAGSFIVGNDIELRAGVVIEAGAWVAGPSILGEGTIVRHGAYTRGGVATGSHAVIGHASEVKSSILLNHAKAPHFAYVGDSILGNHVNLGAGTKISNLKITNDEISLRIGDEKVKTGLRKMGAIVGDRSETGCNSVLNPGVLLGKGCLIYPAISVRKMYYAPKTTIKG